MWSCQRCTVENEPSSTECEVCHFQQGAIADPADWWQCSRCCQFNAADSNRCCVCGLSVDFVLDSDAQRKEKNIAAGLRKAESETTVQRQRVSSEDDDSTKKLQRTDLDPDEPDAESEWLWVCQKKNGSNGNVCSTSNKMSVYRCEQCGAVKPYLKHQLSLSRVTKGGSESAAWPPSVSRDQQYVTFSPHTSTSPVSNWPYARMEETSTGSADDAVSAPLEGFHIGLGAGDHCNQVDEEVLDFPDVECRVVLVGKTGNGKSATANTILGLPHRFESRSDFASTTKKCQQHKILRFGIPLEVVDTPGLFDTEMDIDTVATEITKCFGLISPGPHAILLVLRIGVRFTPDENKAVEEVRKLFGMQLLRFLIIIFTHGDQLVTLSEAEKEATLRSMLEKSPTKLRELLDRVNHRYVVFDNTADEVSKRQQVRQLLTTITRLLKVNGGKPFTSKLLEKTEQCMKDRETELALELYGGKRGGKIQRDQCSHCRDMAREEVVQGKTLLDGIKKAVLPILLPILSTLARILMHVLVKTAAGGGCSLQ